ncbi:hypothetical protein [Thermomonospora umbrina]|uniref:Outer membrane channel protein CpnT-like N-terminal domain-containing protein n=1 Tax=Thermomonospora umbrina TaxID=111806 RepID=A0A3D9SMH5_9ACTN|nr:hypothetical protein [Thermomonospora umbrina]REE97122.1 hypothetical protein DFJ69_2578 [Thermomonospora umbrina]
MGLQLPGELASLLGMLGYTWPEADETKLFEMGRRWMSFSGSLGSGIGDAEGAVQAVWGGAAGQGIDAFQKNWDAGDAPSINLNTATGGAVVVGAGLMVIGAIVLFLKISVIVQLVILAVQIAQAIATAVVTFGASLLQIPIFKMITGLIIDQLLSMALDVVLGE